MKEIWEIVAAVLVSLGGGGAIVFAFSSWLGKIWAERILNKEKILANYNLYASQVQFEKQYKLYGELWKSMFELRISLDRMMVKLVNDDEILLQKMRSEKYDECVDNYTLFTGYLFANAPFINKSIYLKLVEIQKNCQICIDMIFNNMSKVDGKIVIDDDLEKKYNENINELYKMIDNITEQLRNELNSGKVKKEKE